MYLASFMETKNFIINCARCVEAIAELTKTPQSGSQRFLQNNTSQQSKTEILMTKYMIKTYGHIEFLSNYRDAKFRFLDLYSGALEGRLFHCKEFDCGDFRSIFPRLLIVSEGVKEKAKKLLEEF